jgi:hypothetical protein
LECHIEDGVLKSHGEGRDGVMATVDAIDHSYTFPSQTRERDVDFW